MRFKEFEPAYTATADAYTKKQLDKAKETKQRKWVRNTSSNKQEAELNKKVLAVINKFLANTDDESIKVATIKTDVI